MKELMHGHARKERRKGTAGGRRERGRNEDMKGT